MTLIPANLEEYVERRDAGEWEGDIQWELEVLKHVLRPSLTSDEFLAFDNIENRITYEYTVKENR